MHVCVCCSSIRVLALAALVYATTAAPLGVDWKDAGCRLHSELELACQDLELHRFPQFEGLGKIQTLNFKSNALDLVNKDAFIDMATTAIDAVQVLILSKNRISIVEPNAISFPLLRELDLSFNRLQQIGPAIFSRISSLVLLDLSRNLVSVVENNLVEKLPALREIHMDNNPAICTLNHNALSCLCPGVPSTEIHMAFCPSSSSTELANTCKIQINKIGQVIVDCRFNGLRSFPESIPQDVTELLIGGNEISSINYNNLRRLKKLKNLYAENNNISFIAPGELARIARIEMDGNPSSCKRTDKMPLNCTCAVGYTGNGSFCVPHARAIDICTTTETDTDLVLNCSGLNLYAVPDAFPAKTTHIYLQNNLIKYLSSSSFSGLPLLRELILKDNEIEGIHPMWLNQLNFIPQLDMTNNPSVCILEGDPLSKLDSTQIPQALSFENQASSLGANRGDNSNPTIWKTVPTTCQCAQGFKSQDNGCILSVAVIDVCHSRLIACDNSLGLHQSSECQEISCTNQYLSSVPAAFPKLTVSLVLSWNRIRSLTASDFETIPNLQELYLDHNMLTSVEKNVFDTLTILSILDLAYNSLAELAPISFGVDLLTSCQINLNGNPSFCSVSNGRFVKCQCAEAHGGDGSFCLRLPDASIDCDIEGDSVDCSQLNLTQVPRGVPAGTKRLSLEGNLINNLPDGYFDSLQSLEILVLAGNPMEEIQNGIFAPLTHLQVLDLQELEVTSVILANALIELPPTTQVLLSPYESSVLASKRDCSWGNMRMATYGLDKLIHNAQLLIDERGMEKLQVPLQCPLNKFLNQFFVYDNNTYETSRGHVCGFCGKTFKTIQHLDAHFERRHADARLSHANVCPTQLCGIAGCKCDSVCDSGAEIAAQNLCTKVAKECSGYVNFDAMNATLCHNITCTSMQQMCEIKSDSGTQNPYIWILVTFIVMVVVVLGCSGC